MKHISSVVAVALLATTFACQQKTVVFKPRPELDPAPNLVSPPQLRGSDPMFAQQWNLSKIGYAPGSSGNILTGSPSVTIAVLSTGIDYTHEDLADRIAVNLNELTSPQGSTAIGNGLEDDANSLVDDVVGYDVVDQDGFAFDRVGPGTAVAGIIAARQDNSKGIMGMMSDVRIYPVRYINDNGQTNLVWLNQALDVAIIARPQVIFIQTADLQIAAGQTDPKVAAVELASLRTRLDRIKGMGIPVVLGAGNDNSLFGLRPVHDLLRQFDNVVVVTASDVTDQKALIANFSPQYVTTAAPGSDIYTTLPGNRYGMVTSASYGAAHVAGAIGLVYAQFGPKPYREVIEKLLAPGTSDPLPQFATMTLGRNRLNLAKYLAGF